MPAEPEAILLARAAARGADDKKASELALLDVADVLAVVDLFLLATVANERQLKAVADNIEQAVREDTERRPMRREGTPESGWLVLDYGDVVCHVFGQEEREFYDLDRLWGDVPALDPLTGESVRAAVGGGE